MISFTPVCGLRLPAAVVGRHGPDVDAGLVVPDGEEVVQPVVGQRLHGRGRAVPRRLHTLCLWV